MELSKEESEEKPRDLWKNVDFNKYQVKAINLPLTIIILLNFYNLNNNDFFNHLFKSGVLQFLLLIQLLNQKR